MASLSLNKKGQGLPLNTIIISIIVIVVLVIVILIFTGQMARWFHTTSSCGAQTGSCVDANTCKGTIVDASDCAKKTPAQVCCVTIPGS